MVHRHRFGLVTALIVLIIVGIVAFGVPYGSFNWANSVSAQPYNQPAAEQLCPIPTDANGRMPPLVTITCAQTEVFDMPGGTPVTRDGITVRVVAGARWFPAGPPIADKAGRLWQAIFVGGPRCPYVPLVCIR
jgi:hypothetical protein